MPEHPFDRYSFARLDQVRAELRTYLDVAKRKYETAADEAREAAAEAVEDAQHALERIEQYLRKDSTHG